MFILAWLLPRRAVTAGDIETTRRRLAGTAAALGCPTRLEIAPAQQPPFPAEGQSSPLAP